MIGSIFVRKARGGYARKQWIIRSKRVTGESDEEGRRGGMRHVLSSRMVQSLNSESSMLVIALGTLNIFDLIIPPANN